MANGADVNLSKFYSDDLSFGSSFVKASLF